MPCCELDEDRASRRTRAEYETFSDGLDTNVQAIKRYIHPREKKMAGYDLHCLKGHGGHHGSFKRGCEICNALRRKHTYTPTTVEPYVPQQPMFFCVADSIYLKVQSRWGNNYVTLTYDVAGGYRFKNIWCERRNDWDHKFTTMVKEIRADGRFQDLDYPPIGVVSLDPAGEWGPDSAGIRDLGLKLGIKFEWVDTGAGFKNAAAYHEVQVRHWMRMVKATMIEHTVPLDYIEEVGDYITTIINCMPRQMDIKSRRGSARTPNEYCSGGRVDRLDDAHTLHHACNPGRLAYVALKESKSKASEWLPMLKQAWTFPVAQASL
jgi:hypothetical protein